MELFEGRVTNVLFITITITFIIFVFAIFYRLVKLTIARLKFLYGPKSSGQPVTSQERRVQKILARPGVRSILASKVAETRVETRPSGNSPPPPYESDALSIASTGPPPSYHSRADD